MRSIRKITLSASLEDAISWADLNEVMVLPEPVEPAMHTDTP